MIILFLALSSTIIDGAHKKDDTDKKNDVKKKEAETGAATTSTAHTTSSSQIPSDYISWVLSFYERSDYAPSGFEKIK